MSFTPERIARARALVLRVLRGELTPDSHRMEFEEDLVNNAVCVMEASEPEWLLRELRDRRYPIAGRSNVASGLDVHQREIWHELRAEDPSLPELIRYDGQKE
jgi:hypothetical protein